MSINCLETQELLLSYLDGDLPATTMGSVAEHLDVCVRCAEDLKKFQRIGELLAGYVDRRDVPVILWRKLDNVLTTALSSTDTGEAGKEPVPLILRAYLRQWGPVKFPSGEVARAVWEFGRLNELPTETADEIIKTIVVRAYERLQPVQPAAGIVLVCFSQPMHQCGIRLAAKLKEQRRQDVLVVMADDYHQPTLWCNPVELRGRTAVVFVDVVHSGSLIERLANVCLSADPSEVIGLAVIDQASGRGFGPRYALWTEDPEGVPSGEAPESHLRHGPHRIGEKCPEGRLGTTK